ncbi:MAG: SDR family oxidoreductase [Sedimentisphaerales bacterium]|nr:SDR family oxidoreductase [Sedimentisphaerales bacterium]
MEVDIKNRVAIITGAVQGIGKACARHMLENGAKVIIADIRQDLGRQVVEEFSQLGICRYMHLDISNVEKVEEFVATVVKEFGRIDILVNNAGVNVSGDPKDRTDIDTFTTANWHRMLDINLTGTFYCSRAVARVIIEQKSGRIVNIGSVFGLVAARKQIGFIAAKGGVHNMTKAMALELAPHGINVNGVAPGSVPVVGALFVGKNAALGSFEQRMLSHIPLERFGTVDDIANAVLFLVGEGSTYITGHILTVDGGWTCGSMREYTSVEK